MLSGLHCDFLCIKQTNFFTDSKEALAVILDLTHTEVLHTKTYEHLGDCSRQLSVFDINGQWDRKKLNGTLLWTRLKWGLQGCSADLPQRIPTWHHYKDTDRPPPSPVTISFWLIKWSTPMNKALMFAATMYPWRWWEKRWS